VSLDRTTLTGVARAERARLGRTIQYADPSAWDRPSPCVGWSNRDILAHLEAQDAVAAQVVGREAPAEFDAFRRANDGDLWVDGFNEWAVTVRAERSTRELIAGWGEGAGRLLTRVADLPEEDWAQLRVPWLAGDIGVRYLVQSRIVEWWLHGEDLREGTGQEPNPQHWPVHLTCDLAIRMLPFSLGQAGLSFPGLSIQVDLSGMGTGSWHWALAPKGSSTEDKKPDAFIEGRALSFAMVAGHRTPAEAPLDDGNLVIGGNEELAFQVLEHLRAFPD
jgi:uncharacterized protein (TIGR03083 family)